jgi:hypothetical protein
MAEQASGLLYIDVLDAAKVLVLVAQSSLCFGKALVAKFLEQPGFFYCLLGRISHAIGKTEQRGRRGGNEPLD